MEQTSTSPPRALARLGTLRAYRVVGADTDPRGFPVLGADRAPIGAVTDLIADLETMQVQYLEVGLQTDLVGVTPDKRIAVPVRCVRVERATRHVRIEGLDAESAARLPAFNGLPFTGDPDAPFTRRGREVTDTGTRILIERRRFPVGAWAFGALVVAVAVALVAHTLRSRSSSVLAEPREPWPGPEPASAAPTVEPAPAAPGATSAPAPSPEAAPRDRGE